MELSAKQQLANYLWRCFNDDMTLQIFEIRYLLPQGSIRGFMHDPSNDHVHRVLTSYFQEKKLPRLYYLSKWVKELSESPILNCNRILLVDGDNILERLTDIKDSLVPFLNSLDGAKFHIVIVCCSSNYYACTYLSFCYFPYVSVISTGSNGEQLVDHTISMLAGKLDTYMGIKNNKDAEFAIVSNDKFAIQLTKVLNNCSRRTRHISSGSGKNLKLEKLFLQLNDFLKDQTGEIIN